MYNIKNILQLITIYSKKIKLLINRVTYTISLWNDYRQSYNMFSSDKLTLPSGGKHELQDCSIFIYKIIKY